MKIALIADSHLSDTASTPQEESLNWALEELQRIMPDACVWLGDITACGAPDAGMRFRRKIDGFPSPMSPYRETPSCGRLIRPTQWSVSL